MRVHTGVETTAYKARGGPGAAGVSVVDDPNWPSNDGGRVWTTAGIIRRTILVAVGLDSNDGLNINS